MFNYSELRILENELPLMIWMRSMKVINIVIFSLTVRMIKKHSPSSMGAYKYCLYQIVFMSFFSQLLSILGPVFCVPLLGGYITIEPFVNPVAMHLIFSLWLLLVCFDLDAIMDGFNYRCRVLLTTFYPQFANKHIWVYGLLGIGYVFVPFGFQLDRDKMRTYVARHFPYVIPVFDKHKSFYVYDQEQLQGDTIGPVLFFVGVFVFSGQCAQAIIVVFWILHSHRRKMSAATRRMHEKFITQLLLQASVPFLVIVCPVATFIILLLIEMPLKTNICGHMILAVMMMHGPLTSLMTIALYDPYREVVLAALRPKKHKPIAVMSVDSRA